MSKMTINESIMLEYIKEEPKLIRDLVENRVFYTRDIVQHFVENDIKRIYFVGHGTPYNVGSVVRFVFEDVLNVEATSEYASTFINHLRYNVNGVYKPEEMMLICPAHSGKTKGPVIAAKRANELGITTVCTTIDETGILSQNCDYVIPKNSGNEDSFAETKGYITSLVILMLVAYECGKALKTISEVEYNTFIHKLIETADSSERSIEATIQWYNKHKEILLNAKDLTFIGYGENYHTAVEGSLKILETTLITCTSYDCEEFMHGQNQPVSKDSVIFMIAHLGNEYNRVISLAKWCREKGANVIVLSHSNNKFLHSMDISLDFTDYKFLTSIEYLVPFQVLSYLMARDMGLSTIVANHDDAGKELNVRYES